LRSDEMAVGAIRGFLLCRTHVESVSGFFCTFSFGNMLQKTCHFFYLLISNAGDIMHLLENTVRKDGECSMVVNRIRAERGWLPIGSRVLHFAGD